MQKIIDFIKSVRAEFFKVVWPTRDQTIRGTILIFAFAALIAAFLFFIDSILNWLTGILF
ncbi:MAG: preprotein translocase subunit SecE [Alphaproteobacteria bacterium]|nr:preprotein translocase subunit SecE [Alphaproteobacteria bacterium]